MVVFARPATIRRSTGCSTPQRRGGTVIETDGDVLPTQIIHTSDADDEVRAVVRLIRKHLAAGTPGHRIGVYYPTPTVSRLAARTSDRGWMFNALLHHTLADRLAVRALLLGLLSIDPAIMPRRDILDDFFAEGVASPAGSGS